MNQTRETEKQKVTTFGTVPMIVGMVVVIALVLGWFIFSSRNETPPDATPGAQTTVPQ